MSATACTCLRDERLKVLVADPVCKATHAACTCALELRNHNGGHGVRTLQETVPCPAHRPWEPR